MTNSYQKHIEHIRKNIIKDFVTDDSGYKVYWPQRQNGYMTADDLRIVAEYLEELNKEWDDTVNQDVG